MTLKNTSLTGLFTNIANALRAKGYEQDNIIADNFPDIIRDLQTETPITDATAEANEILTGEIAYNNNGQVIGTMPNNGTLNIVIEDLNIGGTVPEGYTSGGSVSISETILKEGDIVLGKNGEDVEILAIHWNMYGFGHKQFYHITSSNNTYFANNILNAEHPVDRYNWIVNRMNLELPEEIVNIIREDSKEYDCFDFTVNDKEFLKEALLYQYQIKKNVNKIDEHRRYLTSTDYIALKYAEGKSVDPTIIVKRQDARDQINILQSKVDMYQTEYDALLTKYSALGTDILLTDNERRAKYFKLACRRDNDNLALFKKYYGVK